MNNKKSTKKTTVGKNCFSGFRYLYLKLGKEQRKELKEKLGNQAPSALTDRMNNPSQIKLERAEIILDFLLNALQGLGINVKSLTKSI